VSGGNDVPLSPKRSYWKFFISMIRASPGTRRVKRIDLLSGDTANPKEGTGVSSTAMTVVLPVAKARNFIAGLLSPLGGSKK